MQVRARHINVPRLRGFSDIAIMSICTSFRAIRSPRSFAGMEFEDSDAVTRTQRRLPKHMQ